MYRKQAAAVLLCLLTWPAMAVAYDGTPAEQEACTPDVFSLCASFIPDEAPILACLQSKRTQLSPGCANVLFPPAKSSRKRRQVHQG